MKKIIVEYYFDNTVAKITLNNGNGNIIDAVMMNELHEVFKNIKSLKDIKLVTLEGMGKHFSFGASVEEHTKDKAPEMLSSFHKLFYEIVDLSIPTLALISGQCLGGGMELALICNLIWADNTAKLGQPEIVLGVIAPVASLILPQKINPCLAESLLITGNSIDANEAFRIGLVNSVYESKELMDVALKEWIEKNILPKSASSLKFAVKSSRKKINSLIKKQLPKIEKFYLKELMETNDANEGINAFLEKRQAQWKNR